MLFLDRSSDRVFASPQTRLAEAEINEQTVRVPVVGEELTGVILAKKSAGRHRAACRPSTPLTELGNSLAAPATRRRAGAVVGTSIALSGVVVVPALAGTVGHQAPAKGVNVASVAKTLKSSVAKNGSVKATIKSWDDSSTKTKAAYSEAKTSKTQGQNRAAVASSIQQDGDTTEASSTQQLGHSDATGNAIVDIAMRYLGMPYVFGAAGPDAFDCSGFTMVVYGQFGISLPHQSEGQAAAMGSYEVSAAEAQPGDLMWTPGHVGIYLGNGKMIHAATPATGVVIGDVYTSFHYYRMAR